VDGLANSVGANYKLSEGAISRSILQAAGADIQHELDSAKPRGAPRAGDVVVTHGHRLRASHVFHGVLKKWDNGQDDAEAASSYTVLTLLQFFICLCRQWCIVGVYAGIRRIPTSAVFLTAYTHLSDHK